MAFDSPILIGGSGRCGTTILKTILGHHSAVYTLPAESRFMTDADGVLDLVMALSERWSPANADMALARFDYLMRHLMLASPLRRAFFQVDPRRIVRRIKDDAWRRRLWATERYFGRDIALWGWDVDYYQNRLEQFMKQLYQDTYEGRWMGAENGRKQVYLTRPFARAEVARLAGAWLNDLFMHEATRQQKSRWCEDTPFNALHATELLEVFPTMKLLYIYRDPRDVISSFGKQAWSPAAIVQGAQMLSGFLDGWNRVAAQLPASAFIEVKFEDMIADPQAELRRVCDFIDLPFEAKMLELDLSKHNIGRWKREIAPQSVDAVNRELAPFLQQRGYAI